MNDLNKRKIKACIWPCIYLLLIGGVCATGSIAFNNNYYTPFYVSQNSMNPTLEGYSYRCDYGLADHHQTAINLIKRYQIGLVYFPDSEGKPDINKGLIIKRLLFKPGERFYINNNDMFLYNNSSNTWTKLDVPFERNIISKRHSSYPDTTLKENEYFFAGDNCEESDDCFNRGPLTYNLLSAVVVEISGKRIQNDDGTYTYQKMAKRYFPGVDY